MGVMSVVIISVWGINKKTASREKRLFEADAIIG
jgi:hypothetical protein